jgi:hypothetical protein
LQQRLSLPLTRDSTCCQRVLLAEKHATQTTTGTAATQTQSTCLWKY